MNIHFCVFICNNFFYEVLKLFFSVQISKTSWKLCIPTVERKQIHCSSIIYLANACYKIPVNVFILTGCQETTNKFPCFCSKPFTALVFRSWSCLSPADYRLMLCRLVVVSHVMCVFNLSRGETRHLSPNGALASDAGRSATRNSWVPTIHTYVSMRAAYSHGALVINVPFKNADRQIIFVLIYYDSNRKDYHKTQGFNRAVHGNFTD